MMSLGGAGVDATWNDMILPCLVSRAPAIVMRGCISDRRQKVCFSPINAHCTFRRLYLHKEGAIELLSNGHLLALSCTKSTILLW